MRSSTLIRDPELRGRLGKAARADAVAKYSTRAIAAEYRRVLDKRDGASECVRDRQRIYMAGCGGMLGEAFHHVFGASLRASNAPTSTSTRPGSRLLDFRDFDAYRADVDAFAPDYLFHLGAHTSLEYCEENPDDAYRTNTLAVENAVHIANELGIPLLYISTAGIFDGAQETYDDWDEPNPLGHYARSKFAGERFVAANCRRHLSAAPAG